MHGNPALRGNKCFHSYRRVAFKSLSDEILVERTDVVLLFEQCTTLFVSVPLISD